MSAFLHNFALSFKSIKKVRTIVLTALLTAIGVVLEMLTNFSLLGGAVQVKLSFIPIGICGMLLGPVPAMLCGFPEFPGCVTCAMYAAFLPLSY